MRTLQIIRRSTWLAVACYSLVSCGSISGNSFRYQRPQNTEDLSPAGLIELLGPPTIEESGRTVFGTEWVTNCNGYGYHVLSKDGEVGYETFYFRGNEYINMSASVQDVPKRVLRLSNPRDRDLIEEYARTRKSKLKPDSMPNKTQHHKSDRAGGSEA